MIFELSHLFLVGGGYLLLLFLVAFAADQGWIPPRITRHPIVFLELLWQCRIRSDSRLQLSTHLSGRHAGIFSNASAATAHPALDPDIPAQFTG